MPIGPGRVALVGWNAQDGAYRFSILKFLDSPRSFGFVWYFSHGQNPAD
jgi:hypothetical protein